MHRRTLGKSGIDGIAYFAGVVPSGLSVIAFPQDRVVNGVGGQYAVLADGLPMAWSTHSAGRSADRTMSGTRE